MPTFCLFCVHSTPLVFLRGRQMGLRTVPNQTNRTETKRNKKRSTEQPNNGLLLWIAGDAKTPLAETISGYGVKAVGYIATMYKAVTKPGKNVPGALQAYHGQLLAEVTAPLKRLQDKEILVS